MYIINAKQLSDSDESILNVVYKKIKEDFINFCDLNAVSKQDAVDMIIKYIYTTNRNSKKSFLFDLFGDIIYNNLKNRIDKPLGEYIMCEVCGERVLNTVNNRIYCDKCAKKIKQEQINKLKREKRGIKQNNKRMAQPSHL